MNKLLLIDDEEDVLYSFRRIFQDDDIELSTAGSGEEGIKVAARVKPDLVIMDIRMGGMTGMEALRRLRQAHPKLPIIMMTAYGTTQTAIEAMKLGAYDYLLKPFDVPKLKQLVRDALKASRDMKQVVSCQPSLGNEDFELGIVGRSEAMQNVFKLIGQLSTTDATALITGESGTGKELVARAIYHHSLRNQKTFLAINCAAIAENLLESELFGHEKGAFTGANTQRIGKFEQCNQGTIFLDEIGDMSLPTQTKILRVLQSGVFERVGGNSPVQVDVRVIAATNKPLEKAIADREFREDLFYRLNVVRIPLPPLRERREDIPVLVDYMIRKHARQAKQPVKSISRDLLQVLVNYGWPGNVRELENVIQRAMVVAKSDTLLLSDLPADLVRIAVGSVPKETLPMKDAEVPAHGPKKASASADATLESIGMTLFQWAQKDPHLKIIPAMERELIKQALSYTHGNQVQASKILGITRATLRKRIEKFNITSELKVQ